MRGGGAVAKTLLVMRRELGAIVRTPSGWVIAAAVLWVDGLLFNAFALGAGAKTSTKVLEDFYYFAAGTTMIASVLLAMRLLAEERARGTLPLLLSSPLGEGPIVVGKYLSAFVFLAGLVIGTLYMPALIFVHGKVSLGHIAAGTAGLLLLGGATLALGTLASSLARSQLVAGVLGAALVVTMLLMWMVAKVTEPPLSGALRALALFDAHFRPFQRGLLRLSDVVFFASVIGLALAGARRALAAERSR
jgi:ABC-2 type transport system permease protein